MEHRAECQLPGIEIEKATGRSRPVAVVAAVEFAASKRTSGPI